MIVVIRTDTRKSDSISAMKPPNKMNPAFYKRPTHTGSRKSPGLMETVEGWECAEENCDKRCFFLKGGSQERGNALIIAFPPFCKYQ